MTDHPWLQWVESAADDGAALTHSDHLPHDSEDWTLDGRIVVPLEHHAPHLAVRCHLSARPDQPATGLLWLRKGSAWGSNDQIPQAHRPAAAGMATPAQRAAWMAQQWQQIKQPSAKQHSACARFTLNPDSAADLRNRCQALLDSNRQLPPDQNTYLHAHCKGLRLRSHSGHLHLRWVEGYAPLLQQAQDLLLHLCGGPAHAIA